MISSRQAWQALRVVNGSSLISGPHVTGCNKSDSSTLSSVFPFWPIRSKPACWHTLNDLGLRPDLPFIFHHSIMPFVFLNGAFSAGAPYVLVKFCIPPFRFDHRLLPHVSFICRVHEYLCRVRVQHPRRRPAFGEWTSICIDYMKPKSAGPCAHDTHRTPCLNINHSSSLSSPRKAIILRLAAF